MNKVQCLVILLIAFACIASLLMAGCATAKKIVIPLESNVAFEDTYTIIWNGYSKAFVYKNNSWLRAESFDYYFDVIQKRYNNNWKSVKSLHRIHPAYNGKAGQRDQTMYFGINFTGMHNQIVEGTLQSSLGGGSIITDNEFRHSTIDITVKNASVFMPYNKIRITQHYDYENGKLTETVLLLKVTNGTEIPFMKNEEEACFYIKGKLDKAPTIFNN